MASLAERRSRLAHFFRQEIWRADHLKDRSPRGWLYAALRIITLTWTVFNESKAASRAAALSFSSLLGLGPLIAIGVLIGGFVLGQTNDPNLVANKLSDLIKIAAPQLGQLETINSQQAAAHLRTAHDAGSAQIAVDPKLVDLINGIISGAHSSSAGVFGALTLIIIVLFLFKSIEDTFNDIWGVRLGRSLVMRVVFYWTILSLGAVLFFTAVTLLGAGAFVNVFLEKLPGGSEVLRMLRWTLPASSFVLLVVVLTMFYRVIPNTRVLWRVAFSGAVLVAALLLLNNFMALIYVRRVYLEKSLYGSLGILPVLMFGLYIFWFYVLIGGALTYALQNVHLRNSQAAWKSLTEAMRERLSLIVFLTICRRFHAALPPVSASQLSTFVKVPAQVLNECLNRLADMQLIAAVRPPAGAPVTDLVYQPTRPLSRINLHDFKLLEDNVGDNALGTTLENIDPILQHYNAALEKAGHLPFFQKSLEQLFAEHEFDESRPPFAMGEKPAR
ncbi:MAG: YihY/virulence factor BrkB family protein [Opitutaceae bacterium]